jgi:serine/threonine protein kinase
MPTLQKGPKAFFEFLKSKTAGDVISESEILAAANWKANSFYTYKGKNKIAPFLEDLPGDRYRVINDGKGLSEAHFHEVFTQVKPAVVVPKAGNQLPGKLASYVLESFIGAGAVGKVWRARNEATNEGVAVKIMLPKADLLEPSTLKNVVERFRREAQNGIKLKVPSVISHKDAGEWQNTPFLVMELASGSIGAELRAGSFAPGAAASVISAAVDGLLSLHKEKCIHRDVKPDNLLRVGAGVVLGDLGIVKWNEFNAAFTGRGTITRASIQLGSWYYMAPEQRKAPHEAKPASDVYALGISWIELLTGSAPDPAEVGANKYPDPSTDPKVSAMIRGMLQYDSGDRPTVEALRTFFDEMGYPSKG